MSKKILKTIPNELPVKKPPQPPAFSAKMEMFCNEYLIDMNAAKAAERCGYKAGANTVYRLMKDQRVIDRINALMAERAERTGIKADGVLKELGRIGYADVRGIFKEDGTVKPIGEWPEDLARSCSGIEVVETFEMGGSAKIWSGYVKKIKFWDKPKALELMGRNQKLFTDRVEHTGSLTLEALVAGSNTIEGDK